MCSVHSATASGQLSHQQVIGISQPHYNASGPPLYMQSVVNQNTVWLTVLNPEDFSFLIYEITQTRLFLLSNSQIL
jgi:hypothetical protein